MCVSVASILYYVLVSRQWIGALGHAIVGCMTTISSVHHTEFRLTAIIVGGAVIARCSGFATGWNAAHIHQTRALRGTSATDNFFGTAIAVSSSRTLVTRTTSKGSRSWSQNSNRGHCGWICEFDAFVGANSVGTGISSTTNDGVFFTFIFIRTGPPRTDPSNVTFAAITSWNLDTVTVDVAFVLG